MRDFYVSDRWAAQIQANARVEADALQARIRPHFLFNSMNLIASLLRRDPLVAEQAVLDLSDLFRAALDAGEGDSTLRGKCELAQRYLAIESLRLGERLAVQWGREEPLPWTLPVPRLYLQPLVENAVLHGTARLRAVAWSAWRSASRDRPCTPASSTPCRTRRPPPAPSGAALATPRPRPRPASPITWPIASARGHG